MVGVARVAGRGDRLRDRRRERGRKVAREERVLRPRRAAVGLEEVPCGLALLARRGRCVLVMVPLGLSKPPIPASLPSPPLYANLLGKHKHDTKRALLSSRTEPSIRHYYVLSESGSAEPQPYVSISWREHLRNERYRLIT